MPEWGFLFFFAMSSECMDGEAMHGHVPELCGRRPDQKPRNIYLISEANVERSESVFRWLVGTISLFLL